MLILIATTAVVAVSARAVWGVYVRCHSKTTIVTFDLCCTDIAVRVLRIVFIAICVSCSDSAAAAVQGRVALLFLFPGV